jgi:uncharacterized protein YjlB
MTTKAASQPERLDFPDDGKIPNNQRLRVLIYRDVTEAADKAQAFEELFARNGWSRSWRNGIYDYHHFHSNAHEVLGIASGSVTAILGGETGQNVKLKAGDVVVLPAGTGHKCESASGDLLVVGAYADGRDFDIRRGATQEKEEVRSNIKSVPDPRRDPVTGARATF